ncbi:unnamed protein product [Rotaria sp. Silwood1]|nr:unnamed protein product [Rotaria sp. Silwood1]CAF1470238.1 unnamed protein product [Rotaria sp. Silwood1]CAF3528446.1 unnamed protein product [Rotaria sp. Silwood1]CAF4580831.1 unnamed protein product [Rotaria sp. Silwood1]
MIKSSLSRSSELLTLNNDEIKRIMSVIERDFKLREKEYERIQELKNVIQQEHERVECLAMSTEFNHERCIRCYKLFKIFFNPKELCSECKLYVCHKCATYNKQSKTWICKICLKLKELECLTGDWFYLEIAKKYKRCGSAKVVRELHKREKELAEIDQYDDDPGYGTLPTSVIMDSKDSGFLRSYIVHDENIKSELNEYAKRLNLLIDNLQSDLSKFLTYNSHLSISNRYRENLKDRRQQIASEITRARIALMSPLRRSNMKPTVAYENDFKNLLIYKTEDVLQINLQQFKKNLTTSNLSINSPSFDEKLAQIIFDKFINKQASSNSTEVIDSLSNLSQVPTKPQRQSSIPTSINPSSYELNQNVFSSQISNTSLEMNSQSDTLQKKNLLRTRAIDEQEEGDDEDEDEDKTPTGSSFDDDQSDSLDEKNRFIDTDVETIKKSNERVDDWKTNFNLIESELTLSDHDEEEEEEECSTWL